MTLISQDVPVISDQCFILFIQIVYKNVIIFANKSTKEIHEKN